MTCESAREVGANAERYEHHDARNQVEARQIIDSNDVIRIVKPEHARKRNGVPRHPKSKAEIDKTGNLLIDGRCRSAEQL